MWAKVNRLHWLAALKSDVQRNADQMACQKQRVDLDPCVSRKTDFSSTWRKAPPEVINASTFLPVKHVFFLPA